MKVNNYPLKTPAAGDKLFGSDASGDQHQFDMSNFGTSTYKVYTALLTQNGANAPTAVVLENTLGGTPTFTYISIGVYQMTLNGSFNSSKTWVVGGSADVNAGAGDFATLDIRRLNDNIISLRTYDNFSAADSMLVNTSIEIRVYN
jgi:hypothetical protein